MTIRTNKELFNILATAPSQTDQLRLLDVALTANKRIKAKQSLLTGATQDSVWKSGTLFRDAALVGSFTFDGANVIGYGKTSDLTTCLAANLGVGLAVLRIEGGGHWVEGTLGLPGSGADFILPSNPTTTNSIAIDGAMRLTANKNLPVVAGDVLPPIAIGSKIASLTIENTSAATQSQIPVTFAQAFSAGHVPASGANVELRAADNSAIACQFDARAFHADGSVRHAVISAVVPSLAANEVKSLNIVRKAAGSATSPAPITEFSGATAVVTIVEAGVTYTAQLASLLNGSKTNWLSGNVVSEWEMSTPFKQADGTEHPDLHARFYLRGYKSQNKARIDIAIENTWAFNPSPRDVTYDLSISVGGAVVYTQAALVHHPRTRYRKIYWWNSSEPAIHISHDIDYLISTKAIPNYDRTVVPSASQATLFKQNTINNGAPMRAGTARPAMGDTGGRPDIGILPGWAVLYLISMLKDAKDATLNQGNLGGSWSMHHRDRNTDRVLSFADFPYFATIGTSNDAYNPVTKKSEKAPSTVTNTNSNYADVSHHPDQAFVPYLVTGDVYYLEELQFWAMYCVIHKNPSANYRNNASGRVREDQLRAQGWALRSLAHAGYICPDWMNKSEFVRLLKSNVDWYDSTYTNNPAAKLGIISHGPSSLNYEIVKGEGITGYAPWQDDHFTASVGRAVELGFEFARPLFNYKAKFTVARMYGEAGTCFTQGSAYRLKVKEPNGPIFDTYLQCYQGTWSPEILQVAAEGKCISQEMADAYNRFPQWAEDNNRTTQDGVNGGAKIGDMAALASTNIGYPSCLQQAVAYCATHAVKNGVNAWDVFDGRTVKPTNYGSGPQFAIVPRV